MHVPSPVWENIFCNTDQIKALTRAKAVYSLIELADAGRTANRSIVIDKFQRRPLFSDPAWTLFIVYANRPPKKSFVRLKPENALLERYSNIRVQSLLEMSVEGV